MCLYRTYCTTGSYITDLLKVGTGKQCFHRLPVKPELANLSTSCWWLTGDGQTGHMLVGLIPKLHSTYKRWVGNTNGMVQRGNRKHFWFSAQQCTGKIHNEQLIRSKHVLLAMELSSPELYSSSSMPQPSTVSYVQVKKLRGPKLNPLHPNVLKRFQREHRLSPLLLSSSIRRLCVCTLKHTCKEHLNKFLQQISCWVSVWMYLFRIKVPLIQFNLLHFEGN